MSARHAEWQDMTVAMAADIEQPDKIVAGMTARQAGILAAVTVVLWAAYTTLGDRVPLPAFAAAAIPVIAAALLVTLGRRDGMSLDRWLLAAARHLASPRRYVPGGSGNADRGRHGLASLPSLVQGIDSTGVVDLGDRGQVALLRCEPVNFSLRSPAEQHALVGALARWLHAASTPAQILVRSTPVDIGCLVRRLVDAAPGLPHPALEAAARDHAAFLDWLASDREVLHREVLVAVRDTSGHVARRAAEAATALAAAEVRAAPLTAAEASAVLAACADPYAPGIGAGGAGPLFDGVVAGPAELGEGAAR